MSQQEYLNEIMPKNNGDTHHKTGQIGDGKKRKVNAPQIRLAKRKDEINKQQQQQQVFEYQRGIRIRKRRKIVCEEINKIQKIEKFEKTRNLVEDESPLQNKDIDASEKARIFVEGAIALQTEYISMLAQDDIMRLTKRLLDAQKDFRDRNIPSYVDIAYHHTRSENLQTIQTNGLLSRSERQIKNIFTKHNGSCFGDGIYCSSSPTRHALLRYGDMTILLARMKGIKESWLAKNFNTSYIGNSVDVPSKKICVLQNSNQCIPLFQFPTCFLRYHEDLHNVDFLENLLDFEEKVQLLFDKIFNDNIPKVDNAWIHKLRQILNPIEPASLAIGSCADSQRLTVFGRHLNPISTDGPFVRPDISPFLDFDDQHQHSNTING